MSRNIEDGNGRAGGSIFPTFQYFADQGMRMQRLCMSANRYGCTYTFRRLIVNHECFSNRCANNTVDSAGVLAAPDVVCTAPSRLVPNPRSIIGRDEAACCRRTGMCTGNTDRVAEPDVE